jgi:hypothetical protein
MEALSFFAVNYFTIKLVWEKGTNGWDLEEMVA